MILYFWKENSSVIALPAYLTGKNAGDYRLGPPCDHRGTPVRGEHQLKYRVGIYLADKGVEPFYSAEQQLDLF